MKCEVQKPGTTKELDMSTVIAVVDAKFSQLDGLVNQLNASFADLSNREAKVEQEIKTQTEAKPHDGSIITGAFNALDQRVNQVSELVKKFGGAPAASSPYSSNMIFTVKMFEDLTFMHEKRQASQQAPPRPR